MKEFKGTPGKWLIETVKDSNGELSEIYISQEGGGCIICVNDGDDNYDIPTDLANARLIAAAPELLQVLQGIIRQPLFPYYDKNDLNPAYLWGSQAINDALEKAKQAINRALNGD